MVDFPTHRQLASSIRTIVVCLVVLYPGVGRAIEADDVDREPTTPDGKTIQLLRDGDLTGWTTWLEQTGHKDPMRAYSVQDDTLRISGHGMGYLATDRAYHNYWLHLEYRWGQHNDGKGTVRNSGVLLHGVGPDGNAQGIWMTSIECQLAQGCEGDLIVIRGQDTAGKTIPATLTSRTRTASDGRTRWDPEGNPTRYEGRQFWWSNHQVGFEERLDTRGRDDVASPLGEWTAVDIHCRQDKIVVFINGRQVNAAYDIWPSSGRILLENEGNEIFFRNIELRPLPPQNRENDHEDASR